MHSRTQHQTIRLLVTMERIEEVIRWGYNIEKDEDFANTQYSLILHFSPRP
jgi:hypothetical protein